MSLNDCNDKQNNDIANADLEIKISGFFTQELVIIEAKKYYVKLKDGINFNDLVCAFTSTTTTNNNDDRDIFLNSFSIKNDIAVKKYLQQNCLILDENMFLNDNLTFAENIKIVSFLFSGYNLTEACLSSFGIKELGNKKVKDLTPEQKKIAILSYTICCPSIIWIIDNILIKNLNNKLLDFFENAVKIRVKHGGVVLIVDSDLKK